MTEAELRDYIAENIAVIAPGLTLLKTEQYIPAGLGTRGFIDLYAKDADGHHVLIELKRSDASAREAIHEIHKYAEGVKAHFGARDDEIRIFIVSTEWRELLVPYSRFVADTSLDVTGLLLEVGDGARTLTTSPVEALPISHGRFIAPWHEVGFYATRESFERGLDSIHEWCARKGISDYVVVEMLTPEGYSSTHQAQVHAAIQQAMGSHTLGPDRAVAMPTYEYIAYFAMQALSEAHYVRLIESEGEDPVEAEELLEEIRDADAEEKLRVLHEHAIAAGSPPERDYFEIGYAAKFARLIEQDGCTVRSLHRGGRFLRNAALADASILSEIRGESGATGQALKRKIDLANKAHVAALRSDLASCLEGNPSWRSHVLHALDEVLHDYPRASLDVSVSNPSTGLLTMYYPLINESGYLYVPTYTLGVRNPESVRAYYGALQADGTALTYRQLIDKYYDGDLCNLLFTLTWGGREERDADIVEDMGAAYQSFKCEINELGERTFFALRNGRWRATDKVVPTMLFQEFIEKNERLVKAVLRKVHHRMGQGVFDGASPDLMLDDLVSSTVAPACKKYFSGASEYCDICGCSLAEEKYMVDGSISGEGAWGFMCADCFHTHGTRIGWGFGQLYLNTNEGWLLVAGAPPDV
ncbi:endonuclease NucS domain-containing protein [Stenotrophomonas sp. PD6]|uniref:endonuclease NucS domain-containing protein n=1 Tax=Stenotrophomonas sp. PD6 TaxID=3368612 RepID=UPI003BA11E2C